MNAPSAAGPRAWLRSQPASARRLAGTLALAMLGLFAFLAVVLVGRRLGGALVLPLGGGALVAVAIVLSATVAGLRAALRAIRFGGPLIFLPAPAILAALTLPGTPAWGIALAWFVLVASEAATWLQRPRRSIPRKPPPVVHPLIDDEAESSEEVSPDLVQQLTRTRLDGGGEAVHALVRVVIPGGDRLAVAHLSFCPPLMAAPSLTAHPLDAEGEVKVTQAESFGARLEVRLPDVGDDDREVLIEVLGEGASLT
ncbi:MAG: hypothetical protein SFU86_20375 [Pirellulaceae bacterium]|nr:hypothetical protein [Pirellulaceae bacterium]